jgi:hypothetical protein
VRPLQDNFFIRRHVVQQLLRQALDSAPKAVHGLLGGRGHTVEAVLALRGNPGADEVKSTQQAWRKKGLRLIASYSSEEIASKQPADWPNEPGSNISDLPRLIIRTDTKGRIEAKLLAPDATADEACAFPLEMQEDGGLGLYPLEDRG